MPDVFVVHSNVVNNGEQVCILTFCYMRQKCSNNANNLPVFLQQPNKDLRNMKSELSSVSHSFINTSFYIFSVCVYWFVCVCGNTNLSYSLCLCDCFWGCSLESRDSLFSRHCVFFACFGLLDVHFVIGWSGFCFH